MTTNPTAAPSATTRPPVAHRPAADYDAPVGELSIYPGKRYLDWDVPDPNGQPIERVRDTCDDLQARVTALLGDLDI